MSIKTTQVPQDNNTGESTDPLGYETTYDGQTFFHAPGQVRHFADDGQGIGHSKSRVETAPLAGVVLDNELSKKKYPADEAAA